MQPPRPRRAARLSTTLATLVLTAVAALLTVLPAAPASALTTSELVSSLISKVNSIRQAYHVPTLRVDSRLVNRGSSHTGLMAYYGFLSQQFWYEPTTYNRLNQLGYRPATATQLLTGSTTQSGLLAQPGNMLKDSRRATLLSTAWQNLGVGVTYSSKTHGYVTTIVLAKQQPPLTVQAAYAVLSTMNQERAAHGLPALSMYPALQRSAHAHNLVMASQNILSHQLAGEASLGTRILAQGYRFSYAGENIAWTSDRTVTGLVNVHVAMYNEVPPEDGHRLNILSPNYRNVGIDVVIDSAHGKAWITEDFGRLQ